MSIEAVTMYRLHCDSCGEIFDYDEEAAVWDTPEMAFEYALESEWTTNGESTYHCSACQPLELTEAATAEAARKITPTDVPLIEVAP